MGKEYKHVTIEERCEVARLRAAGQSVRQIAASVDRSPSTIARELKRNGSQTRGYQPVYADQHAHARRWRGSKLERDSKLREQVLAHLHHRGNGVFRHCSEGRNPERSNARLQGILHGGPFVLREIEGERAGT